jgi:hypothetical protein
MKRMTAAEYRRSGGVYPRTTGEDWRQYREFVGAPLADDEALDQLVRLPAPAVLRSMLAEDGPFTLHADGFDAVFVGDPERIWAWPGVERFGAVSLLDPWALSPIHATGFDDYGAYLIDARQPIDPETAVYVPDAECCRSIGGAACWDQARELLPPDYADRLAGALARLDAYIAELAELTPTLDRLAELAEPAREELLAELGLAPDCLDRPLFQWPDAQAARLDRLRRHLGG